MEAADTPAGQVFGAHGALEEEEFCSGEPDRLTSCVLYLDQVGTEQGESGSGGKQERGQASPSGRVS